MVEGVRSSRAAARFADAEDYHGGTWIFGHLMVVLGIVDAFVFRHLLIPQMVDSQAGIIEQIKQLGFWAGAVAVPLVLLYAVTRRTARNRARLYLLGAWVFFGITIYSLVQDYQQYAVPGTFSTRANIGIARIERLIGYDLPRFE